MGRRRLGPANVPAERIARIEIMTLDHDSILKLPWRPASPERTLDIFDLPQYYVDTYGVRNVQFQSYHVAQDYHNLDMAYIRELRAKLDAAGAQANQINIEIGTMANINKQTGKAEALAGEERAAWMACAKQWVDMSPTLGVTRLMHNQGVLTDDSKAGVISMWKELQDYAKPKGILISGETRFSSPPKGAPEMPETERLRDGLGPPVGMHAGSRRLHQPRYGRGHPLPRPTGAPQRDQGTVAALCRLYAHASEPDLGSRHGDPFR